MKPKIYITSPILEYLHDIANQPFVNEEHRFGMGVHTDDAILITHFIEIPEMLSTPHNVQTTPEAKRKLQLFTNHMTTIGQIMDLQVGPVANFHSHPKGASRFSQPDISTLNNERRTYQVENWIGTLGYQDFNNQPRLKFIIVNQFGHSEIIPTVVPISDFFDLLGSDDQRIKKLCALNPYQLFEHLDEKPIEPPPIKALVPIQSPPQLVPVPIENFTLEIEDTLEEESVSHSQLSLMTVLTAVLLSTPITVMLTIYILFLINN